MEPHVKNFAKSALRRSSIRWKPKNDAKKAARVSYGRYVCNACKGIHRAKDVELDHVIPVVPVTGWVSFDDFIERLFVQQSGYQVLCTTCHEKKSLLEGTDRTKSRRKKKRALPKRSKGRKSVSKSNNDVSDVPTAPSGLWTSDVQDR